MSNNLEAKKNIEKIAKVNIFVTKQNISEIVKKLNISWVNPRITDQDYPFKDSFIGEWEVEILRPKTKLKFDEIIQISKKDGYSPATIFHLLSFVDIIKDKIPFKSLLVSTRCGFIRYR